MKSLCRQAQVTDSLRFCTLQAGRSGKLGWSNISCDETIKQSKLKTKNKMCEEIRRASDLQVKQYWICT